MNAMFSTPNAKRIVIVSLALVGTLSVVHDVASGETPDVARLLIGVILAAVMLTLLAEVLPELAAMLAILVLVATLLRNGAVVLDAARTRTVSTKGSVTA